MSDRTVVECDLIVSGIKKVCHEKHKRVDGEIENMENQVKSINNKLLAILVVIIIEVIVVVGTGFLKGGN